MLKGICPECGAKYYGWALKYPGNQNCDNCGAALIISSAIRCSFTGFSLPDKYSKGMPLDAIDLFEGKFTKRLRGG